MTTNIQAWTPPDSAKLPGALAPLVEVAHNLHWTYAAAAQAAFERLDPTLWESTGHNPVRMLAQIAPARLAVAAADPVLVGLVKDAHRAHREALADPGWFATAASSLQQNLRPFQAAYFCAEFGLAECFQIYSGGLGLLAGDHLKSAADLGLPLIAVGLLYRNGYFHQALDQDGMQEELFPALDAPTQPVRRVLDEHGQQLKVHVDLPERRTACALWRAGIGKVRLYLLDTNIDENSAEDREITANLYLGDQRRRIEQEIVLGIGGVRALEALGERPTVFHMNEGHAAFMALERIRQIRVAHPNLTFDQAREAAAPSHVFTTHTPVPAGIDRFNTALVRHYFGNYHDSLGLDLEGLMALGRENVADRAEPFSMAILAIRASKWCNGVSRLHGAVSRRMWANIWPGVPEGDVPIGHVTNGVHAAGWIAPAMATLYDKHLGTAWRTAPDDPKAWSKVAAIPDAELWSARQSARADFVKRCAARAEAGRTGGIPGALSPDLLTIGFARRFAGYKRATLLFRDLDRLEQVISGPTGFQLVLSGKAHPGDGWGKGLISEVIQHARDPRFQGRILFLEDYGIDVAREMVRGCDVWLNTPIRGLEASGTSGMKAAMNGVLNASVLDGWWDEGFAADLGFKIDDRGIYPDDSPDEDRESFESGALYRLIDGTIVPEFYERAGTGKLPVRWLARMKRCIAALTPEFNTHRMVKEYARKYYFPAHALASRLAVPDGDDLREAREVADGIARYRRAWPGVRVKEVHQSPDPAGGRVSVAATVRLAGLRPDEVFVEVYHGALDSAGAIPAGTAVRLGDPSALPDTAFEYTGTFAAPEGVSEGAYGLCVRILPGDERLATPFIPGLIAASPVVRLEADVGGHV